MKAALAQLAAGGLEARAKEASEGRDRAAAELDAAHAAVEAVQRELAGAEAGDGRDESNRSLQERLADTQTAQVIKHALWLPGSTHGRV